MLIKESDFVLLKKDENMKVVQFVSHKSINMCKMKFTLNGISGHHYGSSFRLQNGQLEKIDFKEFLLESDDKDEDADSVEAKDNRSLVDKRDNQKLSRDEINSLRKQGVTGEAIIEQLVENSSTFQKKTDFSQKKYIQKKKRKHIPVFTVLRPSTRTLVEMYYRRGPTKICNLRMDSLAQILTQANVRSTAKLMVVESCSGLVIGSVLERLAGDGAVIHLYTGSAPTRPALDEGYNFSQEFLQCLHSFPLEKVSTLMRSSKAEESSSNAKHLAESNIQCSLDNSSDKISDIIISGEYQNSESDSTKLEMFKADKEEMLMDHENLLQKETTHSDEVPAKDVKGNLKRKFEDIEKKEKKKAERLIQLQKTKSMIEMADLDGLIVAAKFHPTPLVLSLIDFLLPSRPIVIFSPYIEPLMDCYTKLRGTGRVVMIKLTDTWFREYQVLTNRTHPTINMSGSGGYLLTAMTVTND